MNETRQLAHFMANLRYEDLPPAVIKKASEAIRDAIGVALFASQLEWSRIVAEVATETASGGRSSIWGRDARVTPAYAAMANGTAIHGVEMDDRSAVLDLHNAAPTVSAAMAVAEDVGASGRDVILGVVCGYEIAFRLARATRGKWTHYWSSVRSIFGATAAAGKILGLSEAQFLNAFGLAGSMACGLGEVYVDRSDVTMVKRIQGGGWPGHNGVTAASLGLRGMTGPATVLEGENGVIRSFMVGGEPRIDALTNDLGHDFQMLQWETKSYPAFGSAQSTIDATRALIERHGIAPTNVARIEVQSSSKLVKGNYWSGRPKGMTGAQYDLPTMIAACFFHDLRDPSTWDTPVWEAPELQAVADTVEAKIGEEMEEIFKATNDDGGVLLTMTLKDGREHSIRQRHPSGSVGNPLTDTGLREKFRVLTNHALTTAEISALEAILDRLDSGASAAELGAALRRQAA